MSIFLPLLLAGALAAPITSPNVFRLMTRIRAHDALLLILPHTDNLRLIM